MYKLFSDLLRVSDVTLQVPGPRFENPCHQLDFHSCHHSSSSRFCIIGSLWRFWLKWNLVLTTTTMMMMRVSIRRRQSSSEHGSATVTEQETREHVGDKVLPSSAGGGNKNRGEPRRRLPKLKNPVKIWQNRRQQNHTRATEDKLDCEEVLQEEEEEEEQLEEMSRRLIIREEQLFGQDSLSEEDEDKLQRDFEMLRLQISMAVHNTFTSSSSSSSSSSSRELDVLRSAVASIQQQETQDRRWLGCEDKRVPVWRPQKCLSTHNGLLQKMVESRLTKATEEEEEESGGAEGLSSPLKRKVCRLGKQVKQDLLWVVQVVQCCYPPQMDVVNLYAGLYHQVFSARLTDLAAAGLQTDDCSYLLLWTNHLYPREILGHEELQGKIKSACLGSLLLQEHLGPLENQYLTDKQDKVKTWLNTALKKEEESWLRGAAPELMDQYCFSPLAIDVIQVMDSSLTEFSHVIREQSRAPSITAHLESFMSSYKKCVEEFVKGNHGNVRSVVKAQLACEQQFRDYITGQTGSLSEEQRHRCLDTLSALRDCGYRCLTCTIHTQLKSLLTSLSRMEGGVTEEEEVGEGELLRVKGVKGVTGDGVRWRTQSSSLRFDSPVLIITQVSLKDLWTSAWLDGSLSVIDSLLDALNQHLRDLRDLKPTCRQSLLRVLHEDVVLQYVKRTMKTRMRSREQQVGGAQRMIEDAAKVNDFFSEGGSSESLVLGQILFSLAEVLRLQDPGSVQLEIVSVARRFPDLSDAHVSALLSLKTSLSAADMRSIRRSVEENRLRDVSTNHSPPFFSKVKVKWINNKINQLGLKP
ncbi:tumor necrosis factor alpha-induced protein 2-like [Symphorus nematophorus]